MTKRDELACDTPTVGERYSRRTLQEAPILRNRPCDPYGDVVGDGHRVGNRPVIVPRPELRALKGIGQMHGDVHRVAVERCRSRELVAVSASLLYAIGRRCRTLRFGDGFGGNA